MDTFYTCLSSVRGDDGEVAVCLGDGVAFLSEHGVAWVVAGEGGLVAEVSGSGVYCRGLKVGECLL